MFVFGCEVVEGEDLVVVFIAALVSVFVFEVEISSGEGEGGIV